MNPIIASFTEVALLMILHLLIYKGILSVSMEKGYFGIAAIRSANNRRLRKANVYYRDQKSQTWILILARQVQSTF
jgi:archaellum component FlaF (FlaF/FlaG flagellin family)